MKLQVLHIGDTDPQVHVGVREDGVLVHMAILGKPREVSRHRRALRRAGYELGSGARACTEARRQVADYLRGKRDEIDVAWEILGTPFQLNVWKAVRRVRRGRTITYSDLARRVGLPSAIRAVARANAQNPLALIVPCHRVVAASGRAGTPWKERLLALERQGG